MQVFEQFADFGQSAQRVLKATEEELRSVSKHRDELKNQLSAQREYISKLTSERDRANHIVAQQAHEIAILKQNQPLLIALDDVFNEVEAYPG